MRWLLLCLCALLLVPPGSAQDDVLTAEERAWLEAHGPIRYAPDPSYPPFEQVENGTVTGINVDFLNRMSRNLDIEFETVILPNWTAVLDAMRAGDVDLLGSLAQTTERDEYMDFYGPYMRVGEVFYVRDDSPYTSNADMDGLRVAVIQDYAAGQWLADNRPSIELVPVGDMTLGLEAVSTGQVDAFFENVPVAGYYIRDQSYTNIKILDEPLYYSEANWGVPQDNAIMLSIIEKGMRSIPLGEQTAIFEFWTGYDLGISRAVDQTPAWLAPAAWTTVTVLLVGGVWIVSLRRTVHNRTVELRSLNEGLEHRVTERTAELERANQHLDAFASSVTHDLQKPLTAMKMDAKVASLQLEKDLPADLGSLERHIKRMEAFIGAMLQFSRVSQPQQRVDVDVEPVVREVEQLLNSTTPSSCRIDVQPGLRINADPELLRIVLLNLVGNAWKFCGDQSDAVVHVGEADGEFFVKDNGPGYDADAFGARIFEPFVRGDSADHVPGTGIGLATTARIVSVHGGKIRAESTPGHGATFFWTMPPESP